MPFLILGAKTYTKQYVSIGSTNQKITTTTMLNSILANFYERDLHKLIEEVTLFKSEEDLWKTLGSVKNSSGNLVLHLIGGLNYFIGTNLGHTGYVRNRDAEFTAKYVDRSVLIAGIRELIGTVKSTIQSLTPAQLEAEYPVVFDGDRRPTIYLLTQLLAHLNYHLGQVNYLRRSLDEQAG